jgi:serine/threonine protein kinase
MSRPAALELDLDPSAFDPEPARGGTIQSHRRYRLLDVIGEGGMGKVWKAFDEVLDRAVAIKFLKPDVPVSYRRRFRREARLGAELVHPNLVRVLDASFEPGREWMAMDLLEGRDVGELIDNGGRLGVPVIVRVFGQALDALAHVHAHRIVHRDVKPYNLVMAKPIDASGFVVKLIDFGICRYLGGPEAADEQVVGDPRYMPPEQGIAGGPIDARADLYALGIALYHAATGCHPFAELLDAPLTEMLRAHRHRELVPPSTLLPGGLGRRFGERLDALVLRACARAPDDRFASAAEMRAQLDELADHARPGA